MPEGPKLEAQRTKAGNDVLEDGSG